MEEAHGRNNSQRNRGARRDSACADEGGREYLLCARAVATLATNRGPMEVGFFFGTEEEAHGGDSYVEEEMV